MKRYFDQRHFEVEEFEVPDPPRILKVARFVRSYFGIIKGLRVLECGVARGGLADMLSKEGAECYGVDINPRQISGVNCIQADLNLGLPIFDGPFDVVFAGEVIEHLYDDSKFILEVKKVLKPKGLFIVTTPNLVFLLDRLRMLLGKMPVFAYRPYHYHIYTMPTLVRLFDDAGFLILEVSSSHILFSSRRFQLGRLFEWLGDMFPSLGAHLIVFAVPEAGAVGANEKEAT